MVDFLFLARFLHCQVSAWQAVTGDGWVAELTRPEGMDKKKHIGMNSALSDRRARWMKRNVANSCPWNLCLPIAYAYHSQPTRKCFTTWPMCRLEAFQAAPPRALAIIGFTDSIPQAPVTSHAGPKTRQVHDLVSCHDAEKASSRPADATPRFRARPPRSSIGRL